MFKRSDPVTDEIVVVALDLKILFLSSTHFDKPVELSPYLRQDILRSCQSGMESNR